MFLLVLAHPGSPRQRDVKRLLLLFPDESGLASFPAVFFLDVIRREPLRISGTGFLWVRCLSCHPANKALKGTQNDDDLCWGKIIHRLHCSLRHLDVCDKIFATAGNVWIFLVGYKYRSRRESFLRVI